MIHRKAPPALLLRYCGMTDGSCRVKLIDACDSELAVFGPYGTGVQPSTESTRSARSQPPQRSGTHPHRSADPASTFLTAGQVTAYPEQAKGIWSLAKGATWRRTTAGQKTPHHAKRSRWTNILLTPWNDQDTYPRRPLGKG